MTGRETVYFGKTPLGQLLYDLGFTTLNERYLARKHNMPVARIRDLRAKVKQGLREGRKIERGRRR